MRPYYLANEVQLGTLWESKADLKTNPWPSESFECYTRACVIVWRAAVRAKRQQNRRNQYPRAHAVCLLRRLFFRNRNEDFSQLNSQGQFLGRKFDEWVERNFEGIYHTYITLAINNAIGASLTVPGFQRIQIKMRGVVFESRRAEEHHRCMA